MSVFQYSALTFSVILILFVVGWILHSLDGKPVTHTFVQNDPDQATEPMGDGPDGLIVSEAWGQSTIDNLENGAF